MNKNNRNYMINEILSLSKILIAIPTVTGDEKALELAVETAYQDLYEYKAKKFQSNNISSLLYYNTDKIPDKFKILLNTNLDVVPAITESQFKPFEKNGKLYGRGAYSMKAASAAMILVYKELAKKVDYPLGLQLVSDQEVGGKNGTKHQLDQGVRADFVVVSSTTNLDIIHESKGQLWIKIKGKGKHAAAGQIWQGENALWKLKHFLDRLESVYPEPKQDEWKTSINLAKISTPNETLNRVPAHAEALLEIRPTPEEKDEILHNITKLLPDGFEMEVLLHEPTQYTDKNHPYVTLLNETINKTTGRQHTVIKSHFVDEVRYFNTVGTPGVSFGPIGGNSHAEDEWVDIQSLTDYYLALKNFLLSVK